METTVVHIVIERLKDNGVEVPDYPEDIRGDLVKEHNWGLSSPDLNLLKNHKEIFENVCKEVDYAVNEGVAIFNGETGVITIEQGANNF